MPFPNLQNLHTHSTFCDGKHTPEEMIRFAIDKGFDSIGFSGHSYMFYSNYVTKLPDRTEDYKKEVRALREKYADRIRVWLGLEFDLYSKLETRDFDYMIGAVHYLKLGDDYVGFDRGAEEVRSIIDRRFGGDGMRFAKKYYEVLSTLPEYGDFDILGHIDILTKNCEKTFLFDMESKEYLDMAFAAVDALRGKIPLFEVNTGAMARGYRTAPYPSVPILKALREAGFGAVITSDCHDGAYLDFAFEDARELLRSCGFRERYVLRESGFEAVEI